MTLADVRRSAVAGLVALSPFLGAPHGSAAQGADAVPDLSRWERRLVHESWTTDDGLPVNSITSLLQSRDGYIWIGTFDRLVRFDGARFTVFNSTDVAELPNTPSGFIRRIRVECAAELPRQGAGSVTEIAYSVGFESLSYFRRAFHERFDASPTAWLASVS